MSMHDDDEFCPSVAAEEWQEISGAIRGRLKKLLCGSAVLGLAELNYLLDVSCKARIFDQYATNHDEAVEKVRETLLFGEDD